MTFLYFVYVQRTLVLAWCTLGGVPNRLLASTPLQSRAICVGWTVLFAVVAALVRKNPQVDVVSEAERGSSADSAEFGPNRAEKPARPSTWYAQGSGK